MAKIITQNNLVYYLFEDDKEIERNETNTIINPSLDDSDYHKITIWDMNTNNSVLIENITYPEEEWHPQKYTYTAEDGFIYNENWIDPRTIVIEQPTIPEQD